MTVVTRRAKRVPLPANQPYETEIPSPGLLSSIAFRASGRFTTSGAGAGALDTTFGFLGSVIVDRNGENLVSVLGVDARHLTAAFADYHELHPSLSVLDTAALPAPSFQKAIAAGKMKFEAPFRGGNAYPVVIDGRNGKVIVRGNTRAATAIGATVTAVDMHFDCYAEQAPEEILKASGGVFYEPRWSYSIEPLPISVAHQHVKRFNAPQLLAGVQLRQFDASLESLTANVARSDTLVRAVRIVHRRAGSRAAEVEIVPWTAWQDLKSRMHEDFAIPSVRSGIALVMFDDPTTPEAETLPVAAGDEIIVETDTASTTENFYAAHEPGALPADDVVIPGTDQLICTWLGYTAPGHTIRLSRV